MTPPPTAATLFSGMPRPLHWPWVLLSLFVTSVVTVPVAYWLMPHIFRSYTIGKLTSCDPYQRERALRYVVTRASADPLVKHGAITCLYVEDQTNFLQIVNALEHAYLWHRSHVPDAHWIRWIQSIAHDSNPNRRLDAVRFVSDLTDLADDKRVIQLVESLLADEQADVRFNALLAAAELFGVARHRRIYRVLIQSCTKDSQPLIARHAWMLMGLVGGSQKPAVNWQTHHPPDVAQAMLWAWLYTHPDNPLPAIEVLGNDNIHATIQAMAVYALSLSNTQAAQDKLARLVNTHPQRVTSANLLQIWRAILGFRIHGPASNNSESVAQILSPWLSGQPGTDDHDAGSLGHPLRLAATYRSGSSAADNPLASPSLEPCTLHLLARLEGADTLHLPPKSIESLPDLLRLAAVAVTDDPRVQYLRDLFAHPAETVRDLACVIAAARFSHEQIESLAEVLLNDFNDDAKCSGAILAGLTGVHPMFLQQKQRDEDIWAVQTIMRLGLSMQGVESVKHGAVAGWLTREDLPRTTILLALMHSGNPLGLDTLLNPQGEEIFPLVELLDKARWWYVLCRYLPNQPQGPPPLWLWADRQLQQFQIDLIRLWYVLNRHRFRSRWQAPKDYSGAAGHRAP